MKKGMATIVKGGICKTNVSYRPSPSLFYFPGLSSIPVYKINDSTKHKHESASFQRLLEIKEVLETNFDVIKKEYYTLKKVKNIKSDYEEDEHKLHGGSKWDWFGYILKGTKPKYQYYESIHDEDKSKSGSEENRKNLFEIFCPQTTSILSSLESKGYLMTETPFAFTFYSTLHPNGIIKAHTGPCNLRLRIHLPLSVPQSSNKNEHSSRKNRSDDYNTMDEVKAIIPCGMRIGDEIRTWEEGKVLIFDDCYEHEVWNLTKEERVLLLIDIWHPELEEGEIEAIKEMFSPIMEKQKQKG